MNLTDTIAHDTDLDSFTEPSALSMSFLEALGDIECDVLFQGLSIEWVIHDQAESTYRLSNGSTVILRR